MTRKKQGRMNIRKHLTYGNAVKAYSAYETASKVYSKYKARRVGIIKPPYQITVPEHTDIYDELNRWLITQPLNHEVRAWELREFVGRGIEFGYGGTRQLTTAIEGHEVSFSSMASISKTPEGDDWGAAHDVQMVITSNTLEGIEAVKRHIAVLSEAIRTIENPPRVWTWSNTYGWDTSYVPLRALDTITLDEGVKDTLIADIRRFLDAEDAYVDRGIPWHRGFMLYGPPGTGKTSLVKGLAQYFNLNVYFLSLNDVENDAELISRIQRLGRKSIVLLEDIDAAAAANVDDNNKKGPTTMGLLNILDGMFTPHGMIAFLTTNHPENIDPRVTRAGRADLKVCLDFCTSFQANALYTQFYGQEPSTPFVIADGLEITPAEVTEIFKRALYEPAVGEANLHRSLARTEELVAA